MKVNVVVIFGGQSVEHEISILSAMQVLAAMDTTKYFGIPLYIAKDGVMYSDECLYDLKTYQDLTKLTQSLKPVQLVRSGSYYEIQPIKYRFFKTHQRVDVALPIIHGTKGEDGTLQGYLELLGIPYCGCRVLGAAISQDKIIMKQILAQENISIIPWRYMHERNIKQIANIEQLESLAYPLIVKPANLGSSVGIGICYNRKQLIEALQDAFQYDEYVIVEKYIESIRELNCSIMGNVSRMHASMIEEVVKSKAILSYQDKYVGQGKSKGMVSATRTLPANLTSEQAQSITELAKRVFQALRASGVCRIDFILNEADQQIYVNETNTIPGSLAFYLWEATNVSFQNLIDHLIQDAIMYTRQQEKKIYSYDTNLLATYEPGVKGIKK